jgi:hypothetical protein
MRRGGFHSSTLVVSSMSAERELAASGEDGAPGS